MLLWKQRLTIQLAAAIDTHQTLELSTLSSTTYPSHSITTLYFESQWLNNLCIVNSNTRGNHRICQSISSHCRLLFLQNNWTQILRKILESWPYEHDIWHHHNRVSIIVAAGMWQFFTSCHNFSVPDDTWLYTQLLVPWIIHVNFPELNKHVDLYFLIVCQL